MVVSMATLLRALKLWKLMSTMPIMPSLLFLGSVWSRQNEETLPGARCASTVQDSSVTLLLIIIDNRKL